MNDITGATINLGDGKVGIELDLDSMDHGSYLVYTTDDDGIWLRCTCKWQAGLGFDPTLTTLLGTWLAHINAPGPRDLSKLPVSHAWEMCTGGCGFRPMDHPSKAEIAEHNAAQNR